jgi:hypothetical protein
MEKQRKSKWEGIGEIILQSLLSGIEQSTN